MSAVYAIRWDAVVADLESGAPIESTEHWWAGGAFVGSDWRSRLEFKARQNLTLNQSEAWWLRMRLDYQIAALERDLGLRDRALPAMVTVR